jgi:hypothetical protein
MAKQISSCWICTGRSMSLCSRHKQAVIERSANYHIDRETAAFELRDFELDVEEKRIERAEEFRKAIRTIGSAMIVVAFFVASAFAQLDRTVFGLELGKTITVPECAFTESVGPLGGSPARLYSPLQRVACFERSTNFTGKALERKSGPLDTETVEIVFPPADTSRFMQRLRPFAHVVGGKLERMELDTYGVEDTDLVVVELRKKYGEPTSLIPYRVKAASGAMFDAIAADWNSPDLFVHFESVGIRVDSGVITIETAKGREVRRAETAQTGKPF